MIRHRCYVNRPLSSTSRRFLLASSLDFDPHSQTLKQDMQSFETATGAKQHEIDLSKLLRNMNMTSDSITANVHEMNANCLCCLSLDAFENH